jgi:capsular polysaccharide export protein
VRGVVVVNSTVGLSALHHGAPTKVCGNALYDIPGLTFQGTLDQFWSDAPGAKPDRQLYVRFRDHLISKTQINGSFYKPIEQAGTCTGLVWGGAEPLSEDSLSGTP